jgi:hypothetical protein
MRLLQIQDLFLYSAIHRKYRYYFFLFFKEPRSLFQLREKYNPRFIIQTSNETVHMTSGCGKRVYASLNAATNNFDIAGKWRMEF